MRRSATEHLERVAWAEPPPVCSTLVSARATRDFGVGREGLGGQGERGERWSPDRVRQFVAGRRCAAQALADAGASTFEVKVGPHREPLWPRGYVGSITHSSSFAFAAVGRRSQSGIHWNRFGAGPADDASLAAVAPLTFHRDEQEQVLGRRDLATAVFSAKESLFKCLYPLVGVFFDYLDAEAASLEVVDGRGTCRLSLGRDLGVDFAPGPYLSRTGRGDRRSRAHVCGALAMSDAAQADWLRSCEGPVSPLDGRDAGVPAIFEEQARANGDAIALEGEGVRLSYADLNSRANRLASYLASRGVGLGACVGLCLERGAAAVVSILAVLKAGGAYLPIDPTLSARKNRLHVARRRPGGGRDGCQRASPRRISVHRRSRRRSPGDRRVLRARAARRRPRK